MKLKTAISSACLRKAFCTSLMLLFSLNFFAGAALAQGCDGGFGCLSCAEAAHSHFPGMDMAKKPAPYSCRPFEQNKPCSFEISAELDKLQSILPAVRIDPEEAGKISAAVPLGTAPALLTAARVSLPHLYSDTQSTTPIYLINHSLLC